jgi:serine protease Do
MELFTPEEMQSIWFGARFKMSAQGIAAATVERGSPADQGGLRVGDVVTRINGTRPRNAIELNREIVSADEKRELQLEVQRKGELRTLTIRPVPEKQVFNAALIRQKLGLTVQELTPERAAQLGLENDQGLLITAVEKNSPAARANLNRGFIVRKIADQPVGSVLVAAKLLYSRRSGEKVELSVLASRVRGAYLELFPATVELVVR